MLAILASGSSRRFGEQDKLAALLHGKMLGLHVAETLVNMPFEHRAIISTRDHVCEEQWAGFGYDIIVNDRSGQGQSTSVALAAKSARQRGAGALCICLADMPFVTTAHITGLLEAFDQRGTVASRSGGNIMPPAIFPASLLEQLEAISGDQGARNLLHDAHLIDVTDGILMDIDTPEDLALANQTRS